jgi:hypothetical protein
MTANGLEPIMELRRPGAEMTTACRPARGPAQRVGGRRRAPARTEALLFLAAAILSSGCAALTNPAANGIPAKRLDPKFLAKPRDPMVTVPLNLLQRKQEQFERIYPGAVLGVFIDNILGGQKDAPPPVMMPPESSKLPPSIGFPVVVREDGTISLPFTKPIEVKGLTAQEAEKKVRDQLLSDGLIREDSRCMVTLQRQNTNHVLVLRQDSGGVTFSPDGLNNTKRGTGYQLDLPESESDVANALTRTGGMPGLDAYNDVFVLRPLAEAHVSFPKVMPDLRAIARDPTGLLAREFGYTLSHIPLRLKPGEPLPFTREDVTLKTGDIVYIEARDSELFYVGGIIPPRQVVLPRDYDLDVLEAMALVGAPFFNGGIGGNNFTGQVITPGLGQPSPTNLCIIRRIPNYGEIKIQVNLAEAAHDARERLIVMPGDILILQETPGEAVVRYLTQTFTLSVFSKILRSPSTDIQGAARFPEPAATRRPPRHYGFSRIPAAA